MDSSMTFSQFFFSSQAMISPYWIMAVALVSGFVGMFSHWLKKVTKQEFDFSFKEWFFVNNIKATFYAVGTLCTSIVVAILPQQISDLTLWNAVLLGWSFGYVSDSTINSQGLDPK